MPVDPYPDPYALFNDLSARQGLDEPLHPVRRLLAHLLGHMAVYVQGESGGGVAQIALNGLNVVLALDGDHGVCMPLRYNNDKPENPSNDGRFEGLSHLFHSFSNHEKAGQKS